MIALPIKMLGPIKMRMLLLGSKLGKPNFPITTHRGTELLIRVATLVALVIESL